MKIDIDGHIVVPPADGDWNEREILGYLLGVLDRFHTVSEHIDACCEAFDEGLAGLSKRFTERGA